MAIVLGQGVASQLPKGMKASLVNVKVVVRFQNEDRRAVPAGQREQEENLSKFQSRGVAKISSLDPRRVPHVDPLPDGEAVGPARSFALGADLSVREAVQCVVRATIVAQDFNGVLLVPFGQSAQHDDLVVP